MRKQTFLAVVTVAFFVFLLPLTSLAIPISGNTSASTEGLGNFTGTMNYVGNTLTVTLENTTSASSGFLTAFAFNAPNGVTVISFSSNTAFQELTSPSAPPFGTFSTGAGVGGSFLGGDPNSGLGIGETGRFEFTFGSDLRGLSTESFTMGDPFFVARFQGIDGEGSDKVPAVPEPASLLLLGAGLAGLGIYGRARRHR